MFLFGHGLFGSPYSLLRITRQARETIELQEP
jgi:hypothetical protein